MGGGGGQGGFSPPTLGTRGAEVIGNTINS